MYIVVASVVVAIVPVAILNDADGNDARRAAAVGSCLVFDSMGRIE